MSLREDYREIITKAVCGKGRRSLKESKHVHPSNRPCSVLGCWVINHHYKAKQEKDGRVRIKGHYDVNVWYSFNDNQKTEVVTETVDYSEVIKVIMRDEACSIDEQEVIVRTVKQPTCVNCTISDCGKYIDTTIELELYVELIGETKLKVKVNNQYKQEDSYDEYYRYELTDEELADVNCDFLEKNKK